MAHGLYVCFFLLRQELGCIVQLDRAWTYRSTTYDSARGGLKAIESPAHGRSHRLGRERDIIRRNDYTCLRRERGLSSAEHQLSLRLIINGRARKSAATPLSLPNIPSAGESGQRERAVSGFDVDLPSPVSVHKILGLGLNLHGPEKDINRIFSAIPSRYR